MSEYAKGKKQWQEIRDWLGTRGIDLSIYNSLSDYLKTILHSRICEPFQTTTDRQRGELFKALLSVDGRGSNPTDHITAEDRDKYLSPPTEQEIANYRAKF